MHQVVAEAPRAQATARCHPHRTEYEELAATPMPNAALRNKHPHPVTSKPDDHVHRRTWRCCTSSMGYSHPSGCMSSSSHVTHCLQSHMLYTCSTSLPAWCSPASTPKLCRVSTAHAQLQHATLSSTIELHRLQPTIHAASPARTTSDIRPSVRE